MTMDRPTRKGFLTVLVYLANLTNMERLGIGGPELTDDSLRHLAGMRSLNHLTIDDGNITDSGLDHLAGFKDLGYLNITATGNISAQAKRLLRQKVPNLTFFQTQLKSESSNSPKAAR